MSNRRALRPLLARLAFAAILLSGCGLAGVPVPTDTPTPCPANCPPPVRSDAASHTVRTRYFTLTYQDPWSEDSTDTTSTVLVVGTELGDAEVVVTGTTVRAGTTSGQLLNDTANNQLDPNQFSGLQDAGPIVGAEIGYISGAGNRFAGYTSSPNAPNTPVYIQIMASVQGTTGLTFTTVSPIDPNSRDPLSGVPAAEYDAIVNSIVWATS